MTTFSTSTSLQANITSASKTLLDKTVREFSSYFDGKSSPVSETTKKFLTAKLGENVASIFVITTTPVQKRGGPAARLDISLTDDGKRLLHQAARVEEAVIAAKNEVEAVWTSRQLTNKSIRTPEQFEASISVLEGKDQAFTKELRQKFYKWYAARDAAISSAGEKLVLESNRTKDQFPEASEQSVICSKFTSKLATFSVLVSEGKQVIEAPVIKKLKLPFYRRPAVLVTAAAVAVVAAILPKDKKEEKGNQLPPVPSNMPAQVVPSAPFEIVDYEKILKLAEREQEILAARTEFLHKQQNYLSRVKSPALQAMLQLELHRLASSTAEKVESRLMDQLVATENEIEEMFNSPINMNRDRMELLKQYFNMRPEIDYLIKEEFLDKEKNRDNTFPNNIPGLPGLPRLPRSPRF